MRKLDPHERAAFLLAIEKKAALFGVAFWTLEASLLDTEGAIESFGAFFALWAAGAGARAMSWAFIIYLLSAFWLHRRGGKAFV